MVGLRRVVVVVVVLLVDEKDGSSKTTNLGRTCKTVNTSRHPKTTWNRFLRDDSSVVFIPVRRIRVPVPVPSATVEGGVELVVVIAAILLKLQRRLVTMSNRCIGMIPTVIVN